MAYTQRSVRLQAPATNTTQDYTISGFGTPQGAHVWAGVAGSASDVDEFKQSVGIYDGTNDFSLTQTRAHNVVAASRNSNCNASNANVVSVDSAIGNPVRTATIAWTTDGATLTWAGSDTSVRPWVIVTLVNGVNGIDAQALTPSDSDAGTASISGLSNTPTAGVFFANRRNVIDAAAAHGEVSVGFAYDDGGSPSPQYSVAHGCRDLQTETRVHISNDMAATVFDGQTAVEYTLEVTAWNADGITVTSRGAGAAGSDLLCFLIDMAESAEIFESVVPTTDVAWTPLTGASFTPTATIMIPTFALLVGTDEEDNNAGYMGLYTANANEEFCLGWVDEDGAATSNCSGRTETQLFNQDDTAGVPDFTASSPSFSAGQIQYSAANAGEGSIAAKVIGMAFGAAAGEASTDEVVTPNPQRNLRKTGMWL